jgi:hypothetical protein
MQALFHYGIAAGQATILCISNLSVNEEIMPPVLLAIWRLEMLHFYLKKYWSN